MEYKPGDPAKVTHTVIALNVLANLLLGAIKDHAPEIKTEIIIGLAQGIRKLPPDLRGVSDLLADWKQLLESPPRPPNA